MEGIPAWSLALAAACGLFFIGRLAPRGSKTEIAAIALLFLVAAVCLFVGLGQGELER